MGAFLTFCEITWKIRDSKFDGTPEVLQESIHLREKIEQFQTQDIYIPKKLKPLIAKGKQLSHEKNDKITSMLMWLKIMIDMKALH